MDGKGRKRNTKGGRKKSVGVVVMLVIRKGKVGKSVICKMAVGCEYTVNFTCSRSATVCAVGDAPEMIISG